MEEATPRKVLGTPHVVQDVRGYNSWPMIHTIGDTLVCAYSRGTAHTINEGVRAVYARTSPDGGETWTQETTVADTAGYGEVTVGKGMDATGAMLLWVRRIGREWNHDLYRTADGVAFELVATPELAVTPMQITDVFAAPGGDLMALWFAGEYDDSPTHCWGKLTSSDGGTTWTQTPIESGLPKAEWPTEPSAVHLGDGRILVIARMEGAGAYPTRGQFQMVSTDWGATWRRSRTNICDVYASTPSLIRDARTGLVSNYYYQRGEGVLWRRVVDPDSVFDQPQNWPAAEAVAVGSRIHFDSGNANATAIRDAHYVAYYSGEAPDTAVLVTEVPAPTR